MEKHEVAEHFSLGTFERGPNAEPVSCYLLLCPGAPVTVRTQQVRALNLAWALEDELKLARTVAVIGGGAAGMTFAWAAARFGSKVHLYERHKLMHLQTGSFHRPLHPEIFMWPKPDAFRNVAHMPFLRWAGGTADEVAVQLRSQFRRDHERLKISMNEGFTASILPDGKVCAERLGISVNDGVTTPVLPEGTVSADKTVISPDIIVIATGFGVEWNPFHLPNNSYWRADPLDQSFVRQKEPRILVAGAGDGGLIEILRVCLENTAQGAFLDKILAISLKYRPFRTELETLEQEGLFRAVDKGTTLYERLNEITARHPEATAEIDKLLSSYRRQTVNVLWLVRKPHPFDDPSLPINRFIVSRLLSRASMFGLAFQGGVELDQVIPRANGGFLALYRSKHGGNAWGEFDDVLVRWGTEREDKLHRVVFDLCGHPSWRTKLEDFYNKQSNRSHQDCHSPKWAEGWLRWPQEQIPKPPRLKAEFVEAYRLPPDRLVFRLRIWVEDVSPHLTVRYELHAEELNWPISKYGIGENQEQWVNTSNDHIVRIRTSDGLEWNHPVTSLCDALRANDSTFSGQVNVIEADGTPGVPISVLDAVHQLQSVAEKRRTGHFAPREPSASLVLPSRS